MACSHTHRVTSCGPSGMGETPGNDFIVSLGCGFRERDGAHAGT